MKKIYSLLVAFSALTVTLTAQITINARDIDPVGKTVVQALDSIGPAGLSLGISGSNNTWDYTGLEADGVDSIVFASPAGTPYARLFPGANILVALDSVAFILMRKDNNQLETHGYVLGNALDSALVLKYTDPETQIKFPMAFNNTFVDLSRSVITTENFIDPTLPIDSLQFVSNARSSHHVDAFGTMRTPLGSYSVLRVKQTITAVDSLYAKFMGRWVPVSGEPPLTSLGYTWWTNTNGLGFPLVSVDVDSITATISNIVWLQSFVTDVIEPETFVEFNLYPNPAAEYIQIDLPETMVATISVLDFNMRPVAEVDVDGESVKISVNEFANGNYLALVLDRSGNILGFKQFEILK